MQIPIDTLDGEEQPYEIDVRGFSGINYDEGASPEYYGITLRGEIHPVGIELSVTQAYIDGKEVPFPEIEGSHIDLHLSQILVLPDLGVSELQVNFNDSEVHPDAPIKVIRANHDQIDYLLNPAE